MGMVSTMNPFPVLCYSRRYKFNVIFLLTNKLWWSANPEMISINFLDGFRTDIRHTILQPN